MTFQKLIKDLRSAGHSQTGIADKCGCSQAFISQIEAGKVPKDYAICTAIAALHAKHCKPKKKRPSA